LDSIQKKKIFLSLDIDGIDPAYAPGTGTPEPFGLSPYEIKECIKMIAPRLVGFDVTEVSPPYDNGNTASLAARIIREVIALAWKHWKYRD
ncbi:MAG: arginase family protein, partial [Methanomassiliicoccales archaeon]